MTPRIDAKLNATEERVYSALLVANRSVEDLQAILHLSRPNIRKALRSVRAVGVVEQIGGRGRPTTYHANLA
jgi:ATP-dependent DNA helicase RecG